MRLGRYLPNSRACTAFRLIGVLGEEKENVSKCLGGVLARMRRGLSDAALEHLFPVDEGLPCAKGTALLRAFAENRPSDFAYLKPSDLVDRSNSAFAGIVEWDDFSKHYGLCGLCNA